MIYVLRNTVEFSQESLHKQIFSSLVLLTYIIQRMPHFTNPLVTQQQAQTTQVNDPSLLKKPVLEKIAQPVSQVGIPQEDLTFLNQQQQVLTGQTGQCLQTGLVPTGHIQPLPHHETSLHHHRVIEEPVQTNYTTSHFAPEYIGPEVVGFVDTSNLQQSHQPQQTMVSRDLGAPQQFQQPLQTGLGSGLSQGLGSGLRSGLNQGLGLGLGSGLSSGLSSNLGVPPGQIGTLGTLVQGEKRNIETVIPTGTTGVTVAAVQPTIGVVGGLGTHHGSTTLAHQQIPQANLATLGGTTLTGGTSHQTQGLGTQGFSQAQTIPSYTSDQICTHGNTYQTYQTAQHQCQCFIGQPMQTTGLTAVKEPHVGISANNVYDGTYID